MKKIIFIVYLFVVFEIQAFTFPTVQVTGEDIDTCGISKSRIEASISSVFRQNNIKLTYNTSEKEYYAHHTVRTHELTSGCFYTAIFEIKSKREVMPYIGAQKSFRADVIWCQRSISDFSTKKEILNELIEHYKIMTEICINEIDKEIR